VQNKKKSNKNHKSNKYQAVLTTFLKQSCKKSPKKAGDSSEVTIPDTVVD